MSDPATESAAVNKLVADLQSGDAAVFASWQGAATLGAPAVKPLAGLMTHGDFEVARAAGRALWKIVRHAGRPRAARERKAVQEELLLALETAPTPVRRKVLWMLSEIADARAVEVVARLLADADLREDARCALERIPGDRAVRALEKSLKTGPEAFRRALANSLRVRGRKTGGYPGRNRVPSKPTAVGPG